MGLCRRASVSLQEVQKTIKCAESSGNLLALPAHSPRPLTVRLGREMRSKLRSSSCASSAFDPRVKVVPAPCELSVAKGNKDCHAVATSSLSPHFWPPPAPSQYSGPWLLARISETFSSRGPCPPALALRRPAQRWPARVQ